MPEPAAKPSESAAEGQPVEPREVERHLRVVLGSTGFRGSQRSRDFLAFVVRQSLAGEAQSLHERVIAVDLLGKGAGFDPSEDAIVRVQANEVRKRLQKFYAGEGADERVRIVLPPGGYVPQFRHVEEEKQAARETVASRPRRWIAWFGLALAVAALAGLWSLRPWHKAPIDEFWEPVAQQGKPVIVCIPGIAALRPEGGSQLWRDLTAAFNQRSGQDDIQFETNGVRVYLQDNMVGMGAAMGALRVTAHLAARGIPFQTRIGQEVSFADLRTHPALMLGAYSSKWTLEMNQELPFSFVRDAGRDRIQERKAGGRSWVASGVKYNGRADEDYAIVARVSDSRSGQIVLIAAGFTTYGTQAAAECLVEPSCISMLAARAPSGWNRKNIEAVLRTRILGNTPGPPALVAVEYW